MENIKDENIRDNTHCCFNAINYETEHCGHCIECYMEKCPVAISKMTEAEKDFYCIPKNKRNPKVTCKTCKYFYKKNDYAYAHCHCIEKKPCEN